MGGFKRYSRLILLIAHKDLLIEARTAGLLITASGFALLVLAVFAITLRLPPATNVVVAPIVFWFGVAFASGLAMLRSYSNENDDHAIEAVLLAPVGREVLTLGKSLANFGLLALIVTAMMVVSTLLLNVNFLRWEIALVGVLVLGGFSLLGGLFGALTMRVRDRVILITLLFVPAVIPLIQAAVAITAGVFDGVSLLSNWRWLVLIGACDVAYFIATVIFSNIIFED